MPLEKCTSWPCVLADDDGIRPAGPPDECFYCHSKVGERHGAQCVTVQQIVRYNVLMHDKVVGTFQRSEPYFWTPLDCEFHKNESSWCSDNALDAIDWVEETKAECVAEVERTLNGGWHCTCDLLLFTFKEVVDYGPLVERPSAEQIKAREQVRKVVWNKDVIPPGDARYA